MEDLLWFGASCVFGLVCCVLLFRNYWKYILVFWIIAVLPRVLHKQTGRMPYIDDYVVETTDMPSMPNYLKHMQQQPMHFRWKLFFHFKKMRYIEYFYKFMEHTGKDEFLTLGAGSGSLYPFLSNKLENEYHRNSSFILTDLYPDVEGFQEAQEDCPRLKYEPTPVDAFDVPGNLSEYPRVLSACFHHFPPSIAGNLFTASIKDNQAIIILDGGSSPYFTLFLPSFHSVLFPSSLLYFADPMRLILSPLLISFHIYDGYLSGLRFYDCEDIKNFIHNSPNHETYHWFLQCLPFHTFVLGYPKTYGKIDFGSEENERFYKSEL